MPSHKRKPFGPTTTRCLDEACTIKDTCARWVQRFSSPRVKRTMLSLSASSYKFCTNHISLEELSK